VRRSGVRLVHTQSLSAAVVGAVAGRAARVPVVWHVRDVVGQAVTGRPAPGVDPGMLRRAAPRLPTVVLASSRVSLDALPGAHRGAVVPDAVPALAEPRPPWAPVRTVGMVGRIAPERGQHVFVEAFARAFPWPSQARAVIVGRVAPGAEAYAHQLEALARAWQVAGRVSFVGRVPQAAAALERLDVLVHCSIGPEPFRAALVEAMGAGLPVVATRGSGAEETVHDETNGLLVAPGSAGELAFALTRLALDAGLRGRLTSGGLRTAAAYDPARAADAVVATYLRLLGEGSR
jgi:glycosyltransferase involved in cell wall biosynthesis